MPAAGRGSQFQVNTYTIGYSSSVVAMDSAGDFVVAWNGVGGPGGTEYGIYAKRYDASGAAERRFRSNTFATGNQDEPSLAMDSAGDFVVAWRGGDFLPHKYLRPELQFERRCPRERIPG